MEACYPKNMCLKMFTVSLCTYVVDDKLPSMDWSPLCRLDPRCDNSMLVLVKFCTSYCPDFSIKCLNVAFLEFESMLIVMIREFTVRVLKYQLNCSLIRCSRNMYRNDAYEHDNKCKKEIFLFGIKNESLMAWWVI